MMKYIRFTILIFGALLLSCNLFSQTCVIGEIDHNILSKAIKYSEGLYELLPTHKPTREDIHKDSIKQQYIATYRTYHPQEAITPCIHESFDTKLHLTGYGEYIHSNKQEVINKALLNARIEIASKMPYINNPLPCRIHDDKTFVNVLDLKKYIVVWYEIAKSLSESIQTTCMHIDSLDNYYIAFCAGYINRETINKITNLISYSIDFEEYFSTSYAFQEFTKSVIADFKKRGVLLYDCNSPLIKKEHSKREEEFRQLLYKELEKRF